MEELDTDEPIRAEPERVAAAPAPVSEPRSALNANWLVWSVVVGAALVIMVGVVEWVLDLLARLPVLGVPAGLGAAALVVGLVGLGWREVAALRRLRDAREVRAEVEVAEGDRLRRLLIRIGGEIGAAEAARRAADMVEAHGPAAARRRFSREALAPLDRRAAEAVGLAAKQGFVLVAASPSSTRDAALLVLKAAGLLREIATIYGYRPSILATRGAKAQVGLRRRRAGRARSRGFLTPSLPSPYFPT
ncbi:MAG: hypothetical protein RML45_08410 [Acetobacteraceae bacterium]|nr:hypothetical protein [Acetobacteraceae bacterium]